MQATDPGVLPGAADSLCASRVLDSVDGLSDLIGLELRPGSLDGRRLLPDPERIEHELSSLQELRLSPELGTWVDGYREVGERHPYLWTWCRRGVEVTSLSCIDPSRYDEVCDTKVLSVMLDVLLDDVADRGGNEAFLEQLIGLQETAEDLDWSRFSPPEQRYARFTTEVRHEINRRLRSFPRHEEFAGLLRFDYLQLFNAMRYSHLMNRMPTILNLAEHDLYLPHNMHMMASSTFDLMCSPEFDLGELGHLREAIWHAQYMGRIGNLVTTWQRELGDHDFSSGVFVRALSQGDVDLQQLLEGDPAQTVQRLQQSGHEEFFLQRWHEHRRFLVAKAPLLRSVDLTRLVAGLDRLICLHLGSRGKK